MEITLIQDDIDSGIRKNSRRCPFALAFQRALPDADEISVWLYDVIVRHGKTITKYAWDDADFHLILDGYDAGHKFLALSTFHFTQTDQYTLPI